jgi:signal transduction histidine kinase
MIRRLRIKFVCINMAIVTGMLCMIFGMVLYVTRVNLEQESLGMMRSIALDTARLPIPGEPGEQGRPPHFILQVGPGDQIFVADSGRYDLSDQAMLKQLVSLSSGQKTGVLKDYGLRYVRIVTPTTQRLIFADMSSEISTMQHLLKNCLFIGLASFLVFLAISILLAHWAVKPVETAWEQQRKFVADASHELKTPLTVILSNAQMLSACESDPVLQKKLTDNILTVSGQMRDLVNKLLHAAKVDQGPEQMAFSQADLSSIVERSLLTFDPIFYARDLELTDSIQTGIVVSGSPSHLTQMVDILLDNAQKYSAPHGLTHVTLRAQGKRHCMLTVENDGPPMTDQELRQIFKRFYRADAARERTGSYGLGLSIAEGIVKAHHGKIWAESREGRNRFHIQLPVSISIRRGDRP